MSNSKDYNYGIIYDMDNTVLGSKIDFVYMKQRVADFVTTKIGSFDFDTMSVGQIIDYGASHGLDQNQINQLWDMVGDIEAAGMLNAKAEAGAEAILTALQNDFLQLVLTNNATKAADLALQKAGLTSYFAQVLAREDIGELKPKPTGIEVIKVKHPHIKKWLMVGDSWLDGKAAQKANVGFLAYSEKPKSYWQQYGVMPDFYVEKWQTSSVFCIQQWFGL